MLFGIEDHEIHDQFPQPDIPERTEVLAKSLQLYAVPLLARSRLCVSSANAAFPASLCVISGRTGSSLLSTRPHAMALAI